MKKSGPDRKYTDEFWQAAVKQMVDGGRAIRQVARSLEMSAGTLGNWVAKANKEEALSKLPSGKPVSELEAEVSQVASGGGSTADGERDIKKSKAAAYFAKESM